MRLVDNEDNIKIFQNENDKFFKNTHKIYDLWYCGAKLDGSDVIRSLH